MAGSGTVGPLTLWLYGSALAGADGVGGIAVRCTWLTPAALGELHSALDLQAAAQACRHRVSRHVPAARHAAHHAALPHATPCRSQVQGRGRTQRLPPPGAAAELPY